MVRRQVLPLQVEQRLAEEECETRREEYRNPDERVVTAVVVARLELKVGVDENLLASATCRQVDVLPTSATSCCCRLGCLVLAEPGERFDQRQLPLQLHAARRALGVLRRRAVREIRLAAVVRPDAFLAEPDLGSRAGELGTLGRGQVPVAVVARANPSDGDLRRGRDEAVDKSFLVSTQHAFERCEAREGVGNVGRVDHVVVEEALEHDEVAIGERFADENWPL